MQYIEIALIKVLEPYVAVLTTSDKAAPIRVECHCIDGAKVAPDHANLVLVNLYVCTATCWQMHGTGDGQGHGSSEQEAGTQQAGIRVRQLRKCFWMHYGVSEKISTAACDQMHFVGVDGKCR